MCYDEFYIKSILSKIIFFTFFRFGVPPQKTTTMPVVARKVSDGKKRAIIVKEVLKEGEEEEKENEFEATNILPSSSCFFDALPDHLKEEILLRVPGKSNNVGNIQRVSKSFHDVVNSSERLWKTMCEKEVGEEGAIVFREFGRREER